MKIISFWMRWVYHYRRREQDQHVPSRRYFFAILSPEWSSRHFRDLSSRHILFASFWTIHVDGSNKDLAGSRYLSSITSTNRTHANASNLKQNRRSTMTMTDDRWRWRPAGPFVISNIIRMTTSSIVDDLACLHWKWNGLIICRI